MFVDKKHDLTFVGKSYLSYIYALGHMSCNKKVLLIDEPRVQYGDIFLGNIGEIEKNFLKFWGETTQLAPLINIDDYLTPLPTYFMLDKRQLLLGKDPYSNWRELDRKFHPYFTLNEKHVIDPQEQQEEFNRSIISYCKRIAETAYFYKNYQNFDVNAFKQGPTAEFKAILNKIKKQYFSPSSMQKASEFGIEIRNLIYAAQTLLQIKISDTLSEFELYHLLLSLLSPQYLMDKRRLNADLHALFIQKGGQFKTTEIEAWQYYKGSPCNIQLASYEGVILPGKIIYMGGIDASAPFKLSSTKNLLSSFTLEITYNDDIFSSYLGTQMICSPIEDMGTDIPLWHIAFTNIDQCQVTVSYATSMGSRPKFFYQSALKKIFKSLQRIFPQFDPKYVLPQIQVHKSSDEWANTKQADSLNPLRGQNSTLHHNDFKIVSNFGANEGKTLKGIEYYGPSKAYALGMMGFLMEIKNSAY